MPSVAAPDVILPAFLNRPDSAVGDLGDEVAELAVQLGQEVGPEERIALGALTPVKSDGMPAGLEAGIVAGRRQIKSWAMEMCLVHDAFVTKVHRCVWSAHLTETSDDNFAHLTSLIESFDWLRKRVRRVYSGNGDHRVMLTNGGRIEFRARESGRTGRGRDVNRLTLDEWLFGTPAMLGAQVPMLGAVKDRYIRYGSSPGMLRSESLRALRERGRRGGDPSLSWCEWTSERVVDGRRVLPSCEDPECSHVAGRVAGCFMDDPRIRREVNPAYGRRLSVEFVDQERLALPPVEYARERCGVWEDPPESVGGDDLLANWPACRSRSAAAAEPVAVGVAVGHEARGASIVVAGAGADGVPVVEVVEYRKAGGVAWVKPRVDDLRAKRKVSTVGLIGGNRPDQALASVLESDRWLTAAEWSAAQKGFASAVADGAVRHPDTGDRSALDVAVEQSVRKLSGDGWRWSLAGTAAAGGDASPLLAAAVAAWLCTGRPYDPLANVF